MLTKNQRLDDVRQKLGGVPLQFITLYPERDWHGNKIGVSGQAYLMADIPGMKAEYENGLPATIVNFAAVSVLKTQYEDQKISEAASLEADRIINSFGRPGQEENFTEPLILERTAFILSGVDVLEDGTLRGNKVHRAPWKGQFHTDVAVRPIRESNGKAYVFQVAFPMDAFSVEGTESYLSGVEGLMESYKKDDQAVWSWGFAAVGRHASGDDRISHIFMHNLREPRGGQESEVEPPMTIRQAIAKNLASDKAAGLRNFLLQGGNVDIIPMGTIRTTISCMQAFSAPKQTPDTIPFVDEFSVIRTIPLEHANEPGVTDHVQVNGDTVALMSEPGFLMGTLGVRMQRMPHMEQSNNMPIDMFYRSESAEKTARAIGDLITNIDEWNKDFTKNETKKAELDKWVYQTASALGAKDLRFDGETGVLSSSGAAENGLPVNARYPGFQESQLKALSKENRASHFPTV